VKTLNGEIGIRLPIPDDKFSPCGEESKGTEHLGVREGRPRSHLHDSRSMSNIIQTYLDNNAIAFLSNLQMLRALM
jgi:hypothetical protein